MLPPTTATAKWPVIMSCVYPVGPLSLDASLCAEVGPINFAIWRGFEVLTFSSFLSEGSAFSSAWPTAEQSPPHLWVRHFPSSEMLFHLAHSL